MSINRIGVIGAGVTGKILAAYLGALPELEIYLVDKEEEIVDAIIEEGIRITGEGDLLTKNVKPFYSIKELSEVEPDVIFLSTKAYSLAKIVGELKPFERRGVDIICFQNGIDTEKVVANNYSHNHVFRGVVNYAGVVQLPSQIKMTFFHAPNFIGCLDDSVENKESIERAEEIAGVLTKAKLDTEYTSNLKEKVWRKSVLNSCLMPTSVVTRLTMSEIMGTPELKRIIELQLRECIEVAEAEGVVFADGFFEDAINYLSTAGAHRTSMLVDFENGRPLELDFLNGKIQDYADKHSIPCETNKLMLALIKGALMKRDND